MVKDDKIDIVLIDKMRNHRLTKLNYCFLILKQDRIEYEYDFLCEEPVINDDEFSKWEPVRNHFKTVMKKDAISGVDLVYIQKTEGNKNPKNMWKMVICVLGSSDIVWYVGNEQKEQMRIIRDRVLEWIFV